MEETVVKGRPQLRIWELNENSTRYEKMMAAPSDEDLTKYWTAWSATLFFVGIFAVVVFLGIVSSRRTRDNPFNLYLLYLLVPDIVFSLSCAVTCLLNAVNGEYWSTWMCNFQQWYCVFGIGGSMWLNAVIAYQIHTMLRLSHNRRRYRPPTRKQVTMHSLVVYLYTGFLGTWGLTDNEKFPYYAGSASGFACLPREIDTRTSIFFWLCFFPLFAGIPIVYVAYVSYNVFMRKLLPPSGKRRLLAIYFFRLISAFWIMWIPTLVILFVVTTGVPTSVLFAGGTWSHLQGAVSAGLSLMKPDIKDAVKNFVLCRSCHGNEETDRSYLFESWNFSEEFQRRSNLFLSLLRRNSFWGTNSSKEVVSGDRSAVVEDDESMSGASILVVETDVTSSADDGPSVDLWPDENHEESARDHAGAFSGMDTTNNPEGPSNRLGYPENIDGELAICEDFTDSSSVFHA
jgi:hypothetical protein